MAKTSPIRIALYGAPNCGKTTLFNALTGGKALVANYPGATVEYSKGEMVTAGGQKIEFTDLPGVYGDCGHSADERLTIDALQGNLEKEPAPNAILVVVDAVHLRTHMQSILVAKNYGIPMLVVLNMMDMAQRDKVEIDIKALEEFLGVPVIPTTAVRTSGRQTLLVALEDWCAVINTKTAQNPSIEPGTLAQLQSRARKIARKTVKAPTTIGFTQKLDNVVLHPVFGIILLIVILFVMFQAVYSWSAPAIDVIDAAFGNLGVWAGRYIPDGIWHSLFVDGIIAGVGAVIVFLPQILILFMFILALEASGYLARAAFLVDTLMSKVGLNGRAFIPLLSSFACAIPGIMATRTIENERDRLTTIMIAPLMTCSARWPVYFLLVGAFFPDTHIGIFNLKGLVMFALVAIGVIFALIAAYVFKKTLLKGAKPTLLLELPSYKIPRLKSYLLGLWQRALIFITRAGRIILPASILIWFLQTFPNNDGDIHHSFAGYLGRALEPIMAPIGFNFEMVIALIPAMAAREVAVSSLSITYNLEGISDGSDALQSVIAGQWTMPMALAFLAWFIFAPQCISTLAITRKETNSWKWPLIMFGYLFVLAYIAAGLTYWGATALGL